MRAEGALILEAGKNAEGMNRLRDTACKGEVDFPKLEHLCGLDQAGITCRTGGTDRVVRSGDAHVHRYFTCRIIRHRPGVVVVGPIFRVVTE